MKLTERLQHAWNAFKSEDTFTPPLDDNTVINYGKPRLYKPSGARFAASIFTRIAIDVSMTQFNHVKIDPKNDDLEIINSGLNYCLNVEANKDQAAINFIHDIAFSLLDEGRIAVVPVDTNINPKTGAFDINTMRVGPIMGWTNNSIQVKLYDEKSGQYRDIWVPKQAVAILENPLYYVVNEPNSTLRRLLEKMALLDNNDRAYSANRLDIILQMPQAIRTEKLKEGARDRIKEIDAQLGEGSNGIAYIDGTERITQLNRPANSQILESIKNLKQEFYNQLGLTESIFNGTATEAQLRNYYNRTIDPIILFIVKEFERKFLSKTSRTQGHRIEYYRDTLKFVSAEQLISLGDTMRRNEIATSNEIRKIIGMKRSNDAKADLLANPNIADNGVGSANKAEGEHSRDIEQIQNDE